MNTILIIEDDRRLATLLRQGMEEAGYQVVLAYDAEMALQLMQLDFSRIGLVISDILLPGISGLEFCKRIRGKFPDIPVLMLTALGTTDDKLEGFDAGADDYMTKPFDFRELIARVGVLLKRNNSGLVSPQKNTILRYSDLVLDTARHECSRKGSSISLTPKEFSLLKYLMENSDKVVSRADIQAQVWQTHFDTGTNFIDVYINYLRRKIDKDFDKKLIHTKPGVGFILSDGQ